jgi:hypothetical protein
MSSALIIARDAWGTTMPEWVERLAETCVATSQSKVAGRLGYTPAVVSQVLRNKYPGNIENVRVQVEGQLMGATLVCPALGNLPLHECQQWRAKSRNFSGANHQRVMMYRACKRCPNNTPEGNK